MPTTAAAERFRHANRVKCQPVLFKLYLGGSGGIGHHVAARKLRTKPGLLRVVPGFKTVINLVFDNYPQPRWTQVEGSRRQSIGLTRTVPRVWHICET